MDLKDDDLIISSKKLIHLLRDLDESNSFGGICRYVDTKKIHHRPSKELGFGDECKKLKLK